MGQTGPMNAPLSKDTYLAAVQADGELMVAAAHKGLDVAVPSCPGWNVANLTGHVGRVYRSVAEHIERRTMEMVPREEIPEAPADEAVVRFFEEGHERVLAALADIANEEPVWSWSSNQTGGFYHRRMAQETLVHRWDAENAHGATSPIDGDLAADGVSELYEVLAPRAISVADKVQPDGTLHFHRTDGEGEWLLQLAGDEVRITHEHAKGDAAIRAPGADLLLLVWGRVDLGEIQAEVFGDRALADAWLDLSR